MRRNEDVLSLRKSRVFTLHDPHDPRSMVDGGPGIHLTMAAAARSAEPASFLRRFREAFEQAGVEFIDENGGGPGVSLRKRQWAKQSSRLTAFFKTNPIAKRSPWRLGRGTRPNQTERRARAGAAHWRPPASRSTPRDPACLDPMRIQSAFEQAGVRFLDNDAGGGIGVRLAAAKP